MSYQANIEDAIKNSGKLIKAGADAVKLEGGIEMSETIRAIVDDWNSSNGSHWFTTTNYNVI